LQNSFSLFISVAARETNVAKATLLHPIEAEDCSIAPEAVTRILDVTKGYPCLLQEWGKQGWEPADQCPSAKGAAGYAPIVAVTVGEKRAPNSIAGSL
jgi:hypothetical protein